MGNNVHATFPQWCRICTYLFGTVFFFWIGDRVQNHLVILDDNLDNNILLVLREAPYLSFTFPLWSANLIAGVLLFGTLLLIVPIIRVSRQRLLHFTIFCILLFACALPLHLQFDNARFNYENLLFLSYTLILNSIGVVLCFRGLIGMQFPRLNGFFSRLFLWIHNLRPRFFVIGIFSSAILICSFISWKVYNGVPGFIDSCIYMFQARLFADGTLSAPLPPEPEFFGITHVILNNKWYTMYPPGYPAILGLGVLFKITWLVNPLLGALTIVCIFLLAKELYGDSIAKLSAILACASSFFLFMSSEFASHTSTLFFVTLAFLSFVWMVKKKRPLLSSVVCGICIGIALLCRPYTTAWICVPMGIAAVVMRKELSLRHVLIGVIPILAACLVFFAYNYATTGHPLLLGYIERNGKLHYPGFHKDPWSHEFHTVTQGIKYILGYLNALNYYLFEWPMPSLFFTCLFLVYGRKAFWEWVLVGWIGALLIGHSLYFFNKLDFGPRFVYECLPALIILTSRGISLSTQFIISRWKTISEAHARNILCFTLVGLFLFAFLFNVPSTAKRYQNYYGTDVTIQKYLDKNDILQAIVFVKGIRSYQVHYPFNAPFAKPHIYAKDRGSENKKLAEKFPDHRYFIADQGKVEEIYFDEL